MDAQLFRHLKFKADHTISVATGFVALIVIYAWLRPYAYVIAVGSLAMLALVKLSHDALAKRELRVSQEVDAEVSGVLPVDLRRARINVLVAFVLLNVVASVGVVACLLTVLWWYRFVHGEMPSPSFQPSAYGGG